MKKKLSLKIKGEIYRSCVRSAMLYWSETRCLKKNEIAILKRFEKAMIRAMCGVKLTENKSSEELMELLGLEETLDRLAKANGMRWYGHVLRRDSDDVLKRTLGFEVVGRRRCRRPKMTWRRQVAKQVEEIELKKNDAIDRPKWRDAVN